MYSDFDVALSVKFTFLGSWELKKKFIHAGKHILILLKERFVVFCLEISFCINV